VIERSFSEFFFAFLPTKNATPAFATAHLTAPSADIGLIGLAVMVKEKCIFPPMFDGWRDARAYTRGRAKISSST
jgi:hypothetical protein